MDRDNSSKETAADLGIACESCRKRKLKCSREQPSCSHCQRFAVECIYENEKKKPGFKVGVIETLTRRLNELEKRVAEHETGRNEGTHSTEQNGGKGARFGVEDNVRAEQLRTDGLISALEKMTKEVKHLSGSISMSLAPNLRHTETDGTNFDAPATKRRKLDNEAGTNFNDRGDEIACIDAYFSFIHPWLSILHEPSVRKEYRDRGGEGRLKIIISAMKVAVLRFVRGKHDQGRRDGSNFDAHDEITISKRYIHEKALDEITLENVQALLILTYTELTDDNIQKACSLLSIVTRHIEYLQLNREQLLDSRSFSHTQGHFQAPSSSSFDSRSSANTNAIFAPPIPLVSVDWIQEEEKRRLVWNTFILDRLIASITGQAFSLDGSMVDRKLPVCASFWFTNQEIVTPRLRVKSGDMMGLEHRIIYIPPMFDARIQHNGVEEGNVVGERDPGTGSLALYVEAVECMGLVVESFLKKQRALETLEGASKWLRRFKDLDTFLMSWKITLPRQWADSGLSRTALPGVMDAAMTVANATYNTSLVLLHSEIAFPDPSLSCIQIELPSAFSAQVVVAACTEVCSLVSKLFAQRNGDFIVTPMLGVCAFVCGRALLQHWHAYTTPLAPEFWLLVQSLDKMAQRWKGKNSPSNNIRSASLFSRFAGRLRTIHARCELDPLYRISRDDTLHSQAISTTHSPVRSWVTRDALVAVLEQSRSETYPTAAVLSTTQVQSSQLPNQIQPLAEIWQADSTTMNIGNDGLTEITQELMEEDFRNLDRILGSEYLTMSGSFDLPLEWNLG